MYHCCNSAIVLGTWTQDDTLADYGYSNEVVKVLLNEEYPGWGYMIKNGATTVWERWEKEMGNIMNSFDHPMFGSYDAYFYSYLGGINIEDDSFASNNVTIKPTFIDELDYVNKKNETVPVSLIFHPKVPPPAVR